MDTDPLFAVLAPPNADHLRARLGIDPDAPVELATTGWCKIVVLCESVAVLVPRHHELVPALRREIEALEALRDVGLPGAPQLLEVVDDPAISPFPLPVVERVAGASLESIEPTLSESQWYEALRGVGHAVALVHDRATGALHDREPGEHRAILHGLVDPDRQKRLETLELVSDVLGVSSTRYEVLADMMEPAALLAPVVVHNDLHEAQVMIGPRGVTGIVDWQTASVSHPFVDFDVLQWGRGALARLGESATSHRQAMWQGARGDERCGEGTGALLEFAWTMNDAWWASSQSVAPVTGFALPATLRDHLIERARDALA